LPLTYVYAARVFRIAREYVPAEKNVDHALALDPKLAEAHFERGMIEFGLDRDDEGEKSLRQALRLSPEMPKYNLAMGEYYLNIPHDSQASIPYFQRAIQSNPDDGEAYLDLGDAYLRLRKFAEAELSLRRAIELEAIEKRRSHYLLGLTYQREGKKTRAAQEFAIVEKMNPEKASEQSRGEE